MPIKDFQNARDYALDQMKKRNIPGSLEGDSLSPHLFLHQKIMEKGLQIKKKLGLKEHLEILEIGFNLGVSTEGFLSNPLVSITSIDPFVHPYVPFAAKFIKRKYGNRSLIIQGLSQVVLENSLLLKGKIFDVIFVDGDHSYEGALKDFRLCENYSHENTIIIADNCAPHDGTGKGPYKAVNTLINEDVLEPTKFVEINFPKEIFGDASILYRYLFGRKNGKKFTEDEIINNERKVKVYNLTRKMDKSIEEGKITKQLYSKYEAEILGLKTLGVRLRKNEYFFVDKWAEDTLAKLKDLIV